MKNPLEAIDDLSRKARMEPIPGVDVSQPVLHRIRAEIPGKTLDRSLLWFAMGSACTAVVSLLFTLPLWNGLTDPLAMLFQIFPVIF